MRKTLTTLALAALIALPGAATANATQSDATSAQTQTSDDGGGFDPGLLGLLGLLGLGGLAKRDRNRNDHR